MNMILTSIFTPRIYAAVLCTVLAASSVGVHSVLSAAGNSVADSDAAASAFAESYQSEAAGEYVDAMDALVNTYNKYPADYTINLRYGWLYYMSGEFDDSMSHYRAAIQAEPESIEARLGYMLPLLALERYADVETAAYQVLKKDSNNYLATLRLVTALRLEGKWDVAEKAAREMLALYPSDVSFLAELAVIKAGQGNENSAREISRTIRILDPDNATAAYYLESK
jgi:tetratricopeptide (TPR) repeat protein